MREVKAAMFSAMIGDPTLMANLGGTAPFLGRVPKGWWDSPISRTNAAISFDAEVETGGGVKQDVSVIVSVWSYSHDRTESVAEDLDRLFHSQTRLQWRTLTLSDGSQAFIRRERIFNVLDPASEAWHKSIRFRTKIALA